MGKTNTQLLKEVEQLQKEKDALEHQNLSLTSQLRREIEGKEGWLVTTPNPLYNGETLGAQFVNGQAFVPRTKTFPRFMFKAAKKATLIQRGFTEEDIANIREREKRPSAEIVAEKLKSDFGYSVEYYDIERQEQLAAAIDARVKERSTMEQMQEQQSDKAFVPPGYTS